jgi:hypothetical protein
VRPSPAHHRRHGLHCDSDSCRGYKHALAHTRTPSVRSEDPRIRASAVAQRQKSNHPESDFRRIRGRSYSRGTKDARKGAEIVGGHPANSPPPPPSLSYTHARSLGPPPSCVRRCVWFSCRGRSRESRVMSRQLSAPCTGPAFVLLLSCRCSRIGRNKRCVFRVESSWGTILYRLALLFLLYLTASS